MKRPSQPNQGANYTLTSGSDYYYIVETWPIPHRGGAAGKAKHEEWLNRGYNEYADFNGTRYVKSFEGYVNPQEGQLSKEEAVRQAKVEAAELLADNREALIRPYPLD